MASAFGHAYAALALGSSIFKKPRTWKLIVAGIFCSIFPDADVIGFKFNVPYESFWGHRGFSHSILFAGILGAVITMLLFRKNNSRPQRFLIWLYLFLSTVSHGVLDACTTGGKGVAFLSPWNNERFFFSYRPIQVSPIGLGNFFTEKGIAVILSEFIWIGIPFSMLILLSWLARKLFKYITQTE